MADRLNGFGVLALKIFGEVVSNFRFGSKDAMRPKDAVSCSFDGFNIDLKEHHDDTVFIIDVR